MPSTQEIPSSPSIHLHAFQSQLPPRHLNLLDQLRMRLGHIIERQHAPAKFEEEVSAKGDESPEWYLLYILFQPSIRQMLGPSEVGEHVWRVDSRRE